MDKHRVGISRIFYISSILSLISVTSTFGQNITKNIRVISGGYVSFTFNSITEYSNGKSLNGWTRFTVEFSDTTDAGGDGTSTGWEVLVRATATTIQADGGSADLNLAHLEVRPTTAIPGASATNITLTDADQAIITGGDPGAGTISGEIIVDFDCGTTLSLLGKEPDYYFVDLIFTLHELP